MHNLFKFFKNEFVILVNFVNVQSQTCHQWLYCMHYIGDSREHWAMIALLCVMDRTRLTIYPSFMAMLRLVTHWLQDGQHKHDNEVDSLISLLGLWGCWRLRKDVLSLYKLHWPLLWSFVQEHCLSSCFWRTCVVYVVGKCPNGRQVGLWSVWYLELEQKLVPIMRWFCSSVRKNERA